MTNLEKLKQAVADGLRIDVASVTEDLEYGDKGWDSVGHMSLVASLERAFDIMIDTGDVVDMRSFAKAKAVLSKHGITC